jgi:hypothetical protein
VWSIGEQVRVAEYKYNVTMPALADLVCKDMMRGMEEQSALSGNREIVMGVNVCGEMR